ncbi:MAG: site-specific integrase [Candidatus Viridilinea halotolerans]|uniref:Site-specific integrase n=1 Tax=Candidatus Viridilinea halotolerans TaxID=2491704 RepID=A0A426U6T9_9CHLR|nr:MAG: site-specific integrase [Candidatus Viridilinea halotolerans]
MNQKKLDISVKKPLFTTVDAQAAATADDQAADAVFADYRSRIDGDTLRRQEADLALFAYFLGVAKAVPSAGAPSLGARLPTSAHVWANITHGIVAGFVQWQLLEGYAIGSINVRLATVRRYCGLACSAGVIPQEAFALIRTVRGYSGRQARAVDAQRRRNTTPTRVGAKKAQPRVLSATQVVQLKQQPDTPQGRRDALMICLLADLGLRVGELAALQVDSLDVDRGTLMFYREKVDATQTHQLSADTLAAARAYLAADAPASGQLLRGSRKNGELWQGLSTRAVHKRVALLGERIGVNDLAPHDLRHTWATRAARAKSDPFALRDAGGWSSLLMPGRYVESNEIANQRISLDEENRSK